MAQGNRVGYWVGAFLLLFVGSFVGFAQQNQSTQSLGQLLNPDGSLRLGKGIQGSFRAEGYRMVLSPNGEPRFHAQSTQSPASDTADIHWDGRFAPPSGFDGWIQAIFVDGGTVYFGGYFTTVGSLPAKNIVKWDGTTWSPLGSGINGIVGVISKFHNEIYVGGRFFSIGGAPGNCVAKWDGSAWSPLGVPPNDGVNNTVYALLPVGDSLYLAGDFYWGYGQDTTTFDGVAIWDGSTINPMPGDHIKVYSGVRSLASDGKNLYAGATYVEIGKWPSRQTAEGVVRWDGNSWGIMGTSGQNGVRGYANCLVWINGTLYVGGEFDSAGNVSANNVAQWNGSSWAPLGAGLNGRVYALTYANGTLYAGGDFNSSGIDTMNGVARYDTTSHTWNLVAPGVAPPGSGVRALGHSGTSLLLGGFFAGQSDSYSRGYDYGYYAALWDGGPIVPLGMSSQQDGISGSTGTGGLGDWAMGQQVITIAVSGNAVYVAGNFMSVGSLRANNIACWNSASKTWSALGEGFDQSVVSLIVNGTDLYAGGFFLKAGGVSANRVARWDGSSWHALGTPPNDGVQGYVLSMLMFSGNLYVAGELWTAGYTSVSNIARWNGNTWSTLGSGLNYGVCAMEVFNDELYVGGYLTQAGGAPANHIARWDGVSWKTAGSSPDDGVGNVVYALHAFGNYLYAGGEFTTAGTTNVNHIARWDGSSWSPIGVGFDGTVRTIASSGGSLYAGGSFVSSGVRSVNGIARWDTLSAIWSSLGSGTNSRVSAIGFLGNDMFIGGDFSVAGGKSSSSFARWNSTFTASGVYHDQALPGLFSLEQNYPNPFNPVTNIEYTVGGFRHQASGVSEVRLSVFDILGREVATLVNERKAPGRYEVKFDASGLSTGIYFYRLQVDGSISAKKMILAK